MSLQPLNPIDGQNLDLASQMSQGYNSAQNQLPKLKNESLQLPGPAGAYGMPSLKNQYSTLATQKGATDNRYATNQSQA